MNGKKKLRRKKDTISPAPDTAMPLLFSNSLLSTTALLSTPSQDNWEEDMEEWFNKHKLMVLGALVIVLIFFVILLVCCCRYCFKNDYKSQRKTHGHDESMAQHDYQLPEFAKTAVQPRPRATTEIKELGKLEFTVKYDSHRSKLNVHVVKGQDFPLLSSSNVSFTYVVVELRPFSQKYEAKAQTRYVRNNVSPVFNDSISYQISEEALLGQMLYLSVYDINHLSAHDLIGSVKVQLDKNISSGHTAYYKEKLKWKDERCELLGDMLVGLRWKKNDEILEISTQEASNLKVMDEDRITSNPYVKVQVYVKSFLVLKKRTKVEKRNLFPKFKKSFNVHIPPKSLSHETQIVLTVKHVAKFRKKQVIGQLYFGHDGKESVVEQWCAMKKGNEYVEMWHQLDSSIEKSVLQPSSKVNYLMFDEYNSDDDHCDSSDRSTLGTGSAHEYRSF